jgi:preprotein translocase subunit SecG
MQTVVIVIHLMVVLAMIGAVMLQRSEGGGLGMGGGGGGAGFLTSRGTANVLTRTTATLALIFFITSLTLSILAGLDRKPRSIIQGSSPTGEQAPSGTPAPAGQDGRGVLDPLRGLAKPQTEPAPSTPQVPQSR